MQWVECSVGPLAGAAQVISSEVSRFVSGGSQNESARALAIEQVETQLSVCYDVAVRDAYEAPMRAWVLISCILVLLLSFIHGQLWAATLVLSAIKRVFFAILTWCGCTRRQSDDDTARLVGGLLSG